ncbi:DUF3883 domain-containing protein [Clostridium botulinum]|uniref:Protein NO VEIN C-terminal domain-containing protein n=1 Tax=Clostridium botulinum (strain Eklund 17B / Type B) TaxID=935198 RepID=B2TKL0_CLOBB|nr:conserved hypothetical protein [Clostridium botulinum B str. Eklund 17B (NRP)]MBY6976486.1 DUF3883 domain-containing protein [Clostridium botulinum]MBY7001581.1 DUF3883 domain-containing protein [Clostridium botulinum]MCR1274418.1 DUF3883 domain-containing protein [Clostridium botulinum]NFD69095.1 DUF3883 domain-containing protein [Clostridium botulinum]
MIIKFEDLQDANLIVNGIYKSGNKGNYSDEALSKLMRCENSCGFRKKGSLKNPNLQYVVLYSTGKQKDWKNILNVDTSEFIYYGDQNKVNKEIHDTPKKGNEVLRRTFEDLKKRNRSNIAPFFVFIKQEKRDVKFIGLAVPGSKNRSIEECLQVVTIDKINGQIKNYKAIFTILDVKEINRRWLDDLEKENGLTSQYVPIEWKLWVEDSIYNTSLIKEIEEQDGENLNKLSVEKELLENININELNHLVKNIDELQFEITYKPMDNEKEENLDDKTEIKNKFIKPRKNKNYIEEYTKKQIIGAIGECIILKNEKERLKNSRQAELVRKADDIEWSSKFIGDGLGYDIKSFDIKDGKVINKYIEVKTTVGQDEYFEITVNEVNKSKTLNTNGLYVLARVYNLDIKNKTANFYFKEGNLESNYDLKTRVYIAYRK